MYQAALLFAIFADVASALISYFLVNQIAKGIAKHKTVLTLCSWTVLFFGFVTSMFVLTALINASFGAYFVPAFPTLFIWAIEIVLLVFPFNLLFIGTWIFGALLCNVRKARGVLACVCATHFGILLDDVDIGQSVQKNGWDKDRKKNIRKSLSCVEERYKERYLVGVVFKSFCITLFI